MSDLQRIEKKLDKVLKHIEKENNGGRKSKWKIRTKKGIPSQVTRKILSKLKKGDKFEGLKATDIDLILNSHDIKYSAPTIRKKMRKLEKEFDAVVLNERVGAKGLEIQWHSENIQ